MINNVMKAIKNVVISMRPEQWTKNVIVFAGLFFGMKLNGVANIITITEIFFIFCIVSSGSYMINDVIDRKEDCYHPDKSKRPIASGSLSSRLALIVAFALIAIGIIGAMFISSRLLVLLVLFLTLHFSYDIFLKHISIVDVMVIALAFIIRLLSGVVMAPIDNSVSLWILLCTFLLALFLALCKRRAEVALLLEASSRHRKSLRGYSAQFLDQLITIAGGATILSYSLYALSPETILKHGTDKLIFTIPFVIYGIFRYLYLVSIKKGGSNPEKLLIKDTPLLVSILLYCVTAYLVLYNR